MKTLLKILSFIIVSAPMVEAQTQLRQVTPQAIQTRGVPGRYRILITRSLKSYDEVQIMRFTKVTISFTHRTGMETLGLDDMPIEVQQACNYVPEVSITANETQKTSSTPEQIESIRRSETRRYLQLMEEENGAVMCHAWGIGGSRDPEVIALRKTGKQLTEYKNEFIYPLHKTDRFSPQHENAVVVGLNWINKNESTVVLSLYLVKKGGAAEPYVYATSLTEAAKYLAAKSK
ncbi:MAG: hypothetical protein WAW39_17135 [Prosthecobacter sp.]|uniref:hypothetical protein n=1 Tax=Prosthecobacter sp. TaxID=1965333 RepID=UPI003BB07EC9